jgi:tRNA(Ile)-lysidine synthase
MFLTTLAETAKTKCKLDFKTPILIGVSGGADSLALLHGLHRLGYPLVVAHLDHAIRAESAGDADYVRQKAESLGLPFYSQRMDVHAFSEKEHLSLEEAARTVRYQFLFSLAREVGAQVVAVAHHADDQVETVLMHFLRGAALSGLSGMAYRTVMPVWDAEIPLVRPLLDLWREDIETYITQLDWHPREDLTNRDTTYYRNRLRHELIPELESYNPKFKEVLWRMANVLGEEDRFLTSLANQAWETCYIKKTEGRVELDYVIFLTLENALQRRVLRKAIELLRPDLRDVGFDVVVRGLAFLAAPSESGEIDLVSRLNLGIMGGRLVIKTWVAEWPDFNQPLLKSEDFEAELESRKPLLLKHGWQLLASSIQPAPDDAQDRAENLPENEVWLDAEKLKYPLVVRSRQEGERWEPLGMGGHTQKLSDFFINAKVPVHLRGRWPLVCDQHQVVWIPPFRPAENCRVTVETKKVIHLRLQRKIAR